MSETQTWGGDTDMFSDPAERKLIFSVLDSFRQYRRAAHLNTTHVRRQRFYALATRQWNLLSEPPFSLLSTLSQVDDAIDVNADLAEAILDAALTSLGLENTVDGQNVPEWKGCATKINLDKARSTLNQLYRDWSAEGASERSACFEPLLEDLYEYFSLEDIQREEGIRVLVPGAGLGRLVFELCRAGFNTEGNEISYHQLLASSFILNNTKAANEWIMHPFAQSFSNHLNREDQLRTVTVPDMHPGTTCLAGSMSMSTGDFCVVYRSDEYKAQFDAVVTLFFIDTAPNLIKYIEAIKSCLKPGGVWTNVGPLLWHFDAETTGGEDTRDQTSDETGPSDQIMTEDRGVGEPGSFELSQDEVVKLVEHFGFTITKHETNRIETGYMQNSRSMLQYLYKPVHWVARKK